MGYLGLIIGYLIIFLTPVIGLWQKRFPEIERKETDAFIPFYNYFALLRACKLPWYWMIFLLFPGVQFIMWAALNVSYIRKFGEFGVKETILGILFPFPVFWKIAKNPEQYKPAAPTNWDVQKQVDMRTPSDHVALFFALPVIGHAIAYPFSLLGVKRKPGKKSIFKEWGDAILFAVVAASVIRTYIFEPYKIPTGSMEKTLLIGDHLFVDKLTYGPRVPMTPWSYPIVHNSFAPLIDMKSYLEFQTIPYTRLPGFRDVERYDVVVFNFPAGDTAINDPRMPDGLIGHNYHEILRDEALYICLYEDHRGLAFFEQNYDYYISKARKRFYEDNMVKSRIVRKEDQERGYTAFNGVLSRPVDKKENYIKRCVGLPGDLLEIRDKELYINGELAFQPPHRQYSYVLKDSNHLHPYFQEWMAMRMGTNDKFYWTQEDEGFFLANFDTPLNYIGFDEEGYPTFTLPFLEYEKLKSKFPLEPFVKEKGFYRKQLELGLSSSYCHIFPNDRNYDWTEDNFGPLKIPAAGDVVQLSKENIAIYRRIITAYEGHKLEEKADGIYIDGKLVDAYTVQMNYYWMMGDNRNGSADSRFWGFVPEDHIVGHAAFIWMSVDQEKGMFGGGMQWGRMFSGIE